MNKLGIPSYLTRGEAKVFQLAPVTLLADHVRVTLAESVVAVALLGAAFVTDTRLAVLERDRVPEVAGAAQAARLAERVVQALQALARHRIARARVVRVDVARALARLAEVAYERNALASEYLVGFGWNRQGPRGEGGKGSKPRVA
jgi:hypothetical protein